MHVYNIHAYSKTNENCCVAITGQSFACMAGLLFQQVVYMMSLVFIIKIANQRFNRNQWALLGPYISHTQYERIVNNDEYLSNHFRLMSIYKKEVSHI